MTAKEIAGMSAIVDDITEKAHHLDLFEKYSSVGVCRYEEGEPFARIYASNGSFLAPQATRFPRNDRSNAHDKMAYFTAGLSIADPRRSMDLRAVRWITDNNVADVCDKYIKERSDWLATLSNPQLVKLLRAEWYLDTNRSRKNEAFLKRDVITEKEVGRRFDLCDSAEMYCKLWDACARSPVLGRLDEREIFLTNCLMLLVNNLSAWCSELPNSVSSKIDERLKKIWASYIFRSKRNWLLQANVGEAQVWLDKCKKFLSCADWGLSEKKRHDCLREMLNNFFSKEDSEIQAYGIDYFITLLNEIDDSATKQGLSDRFQSIFVTPVPSDEWTLRWERCRLYIDKVANNNDQVSSIQWLDAELRRMAAASSADVLSHSVDKTVRFLSDLPADNLALFSNHIEALLIANALAVDLESNGVRVFQMGVADTHNRGGRFWDLSRMPPNSEPLVIAQLVKELAGKWLVGHNVIDFDLPMLFGLAKDNDKQIFDAKTRPVWDTMLASMVITPWKPTHALLSANHRADLDAQAALDLFKKQVETLGLNCAELILGREPYTLAKWFTILETVEIKELPKVPEFLIDIPAHTYVVIPKAWLSRVAWLPEVGYQFPSGHIDEQDRMIAAADVKRWQDENGGTDACHLALFSLLARCEGAKIRIRVGNLPLWLQRKCEGCIRSVSKVSEDDPSSFRWVVSTYESYCKTGIEVPPHGGSVNWVAPQMASLVKAVQSAHIVSEQEALGVCGKHSEVVRQPGSDHRLIDCGLDKSGETVWLEWHPGRAQWLSWRSKAFCDALADQKTDANLSFIRPSWLDMGRYGEVVGVDSLWPTTACRYPYWRDTLPKVISLLARKEGKCHILVLVSAKTPERGVIEDLLVDLGKAWPASTAKAEILRKAKDESCCVVVDQEQVAEWLQLSTDESHLTFEFVIESLPIELWLTCCKAEEQDRSAEVDYDDDDDRSRADDEKIPSSDEEDSDTKGIGSDLNETDDTRTHGSGLYHFSEADIERAITSYLAIWLQSEFCDHVPVILDSRLNIIRTKQLSRVGKQEEVELLPLSPEAEQAFEDRKVSLGGRKENTCLPERAALFQEYERFLGQYWKRPDNSPAEFRETQMPAVLAIAEGRHVLVRLPTGEGKSVVFQVPALINASHTGKLTVVVTPLRALMKDQVENLRKKGLGLLTVDYLSGDRDPWETAEVYQHILDGCIELLFVAPERFRVNRFRDVLARRVAMDNGLGFAVIDEAHCISQWGYEFRPDYLYAISEINKSFLKPELSTQLLLLSATVTKNTQQILAEVTGLSGEGESALVKCPDGYNFPIKDHLQIEPKEVDVGLYGKEWESNIEFRLPKLTEVIKKSNPEVSTVLIFVTRRAHAEHLRDRLRQEVGLSAFNIEAFHAGMPSDERQRILESLDPRKNEPAVRTSVLISTKAFGMGMDIPNIHWAVHLSPPSFLEDYLQEIGRCGRDEAWLKRAGLEKLICNLLWNPTDFERNHENVKRGLIEAESLRKLWDEITRRKIVADDGSLLCVLPTDAPELKNDAPPDKLGRALSWLENEPSSRVEIIGKLPDMLRMKVWHDRLVVAAQGESDVASVAEALLLVFRQIPDQDKVRHAPERVQDGVCSLSNEPKTSAPVAVDGGGLLSIIRRFVGFFIRSSSNSKTVPAPVVTVADTAVSAVMHQPVHGDEVSNVELNMGEVFRRSGLSSPDAMWRALCALLQNRAIVFERTLIFKRMEQCDYQTPLLEGFQRTVEALCQNRSDIACDNLSELLPELNIHPIAGQEVPNAQCMTRSVCWAAVKFLRRAGVRIREMSDPQGTRVLRYSVSERIRGVIDGQLDTCMRLTRDCSQLIRNASAAEKVKDGKQVNLDELVRLINNSGRLTDLRAAIGLIEDLKLWKTEQELLPQSYLLRLLTDEPLAIPKAETVPHEEPETVAGLQEGQIANDRKMFERLSQINRFSELRSFAMELFCLLPDDQSRNTFIDAYFEEATDPEALHQVMERFLREVGSAGSDYLRDMLGKIQGEAFIEAFDGIDGKGGLSEEQKAVVQAAFSQNMLVNAGPGAGKTHVLMMRAAHLIHRQRLQPEQILILAFNRAVVHEIRTRIKDLFTKLGYGAYVRSLRVRTFHAFALEHMHETIDNANNNALTLMVHNFSDRLLNDDAFANTVVGGTRAILVDEFQDMTSDFYTVVKTLATTARETNGAGIMVIGDDDQDIMQWARRKAGDSIADGSEYFKTFVADVPNAATLNLTTNYRSLKEIVDSSQRLINAERSEHLDIPRQKTNIILKPYRTGIGEVRFLKNSAEWSDVQLLSFISQAKEANQSCAILCRTNSQVVQLYEIVRHEFSEVMILGEEGFRLGQLRHIAVFSDIIKERLSKDGNLPLSDKILEVMLTRFKAELIPEATDEAAIQEIRSIWAHAQKEKRGAQLEDFLGFVDDIRTDDFSRIKEKQSELDGKPQFSVVLSTIHKVKGLQFDRVWIQPSNARFPYDNGVAIANGLREADRMDLLMPYAIEEAKLFYVAMTRAKDIVYCGWGEREKAWFNDIVKRDAVDDGMHTVFLAGKLGDYFISFPALNEQRQDFIERRIEIGDIITVERTADDWLGLVCRKDVNGEQSGGSVARWETGTHDAVWSVNHGTNDYLGPLNTSLRVVAVCRYPHDPEFQILPVYEKQGWYYTVLIAGFVRLGH